MANRYAEDIRRIVGIEETDGSLKEAKERERIKGGRGVGYYSGSATGGGTGQRQVSGTSGFPSSGSGADLPGDSANNPQGDLSNQTNGSEGEASGGVSEGREGAFDASNPYSLITDFANSQTDIADVIDNWSFNSPDALRTITGVDPSTGTDLDLYTNGFYPPPEGWDDPDVPPGSAEDPTFQVGFYWEHLSALVSGFFQSPLQAHQEFVAQHTAQQASFGNEYEYELKAVDSSTYQSCFRQVVSDGDPLPSPGPESCIDIARSACTGSDPSGPGDYCSTEPPLLSESPDSWPILDKIITVFNGASTEINEFQNPQDLIGYTQEGTSKLNIESKDQPGRYFSVEANATGGTLVYETSTPGGAPTGVYKTFDATGRFTGYGDSSSIDYIRPDSG